MVGWEVAAPALEQKGTWCERGLSNSGPSRTVPLSVTCREAKSGRDNRVAQVRRSSTAPDRVETQRCWGRRGSSDAAFLWTCWL